MTVDDLPSERLQEVELCQACRQNPVEAVLDNEQPDQPYRLCLACAHRIEMFSLRPLEWFNLAAIHGPNKFLLHDDFYYENGTAGQPEDEVEEPERFPAPTLEQAAKMERLIDFAMTERMLGKETAERLREISPPALLEALKARVGASGNVEIEARAYDICATVLGEAAQDWVRERWACYSPETLYSLACATARSLPFAEGFTRVTAVLETRTARDLSLDCYAFAPFQTAEVLDWMETHPELIVHENWGRLAALSHMTWGRADAWLELGRPLSLRALEALILCHRYDTVLLGSA
jgi:hypothetical protein